MAITGRTLVTDALTEINVAVPGQPLSAADANWLLGKLNSELDYWSARKVYAYNVGFQRYTLIPNHSPHTIGPTGDFVVTQRPVRIAAWDLIVSTGGSTEVDLPRKPVRDDDWWASVQLKSLATNVPTDLYYSPDFPNGSLYFWPISNIAQDVRLELWGLLTQLVDLNATIALPPAYKKALTLTLAELACPRYNKEVHPILAREAAGARRAVQGNNNQSPRIATADFGMPTRSGRKNDFNWVTGNIV